MRTFLAVCLLIYLGIAAVLYFSQARLLYLPARKITATPADIGLEYQQIFFRTKDNLTLAGWFVPAEDPRGVLLFCHGNAGNISHRLDSILIFQRLGFSVFLFDYRGYGQSEGQPTEQGLYRDAEAAWRYLTEKQGIASEDIVLFGRSLGGAVAARLAERHSPRACILESTPTSIPDMAAELYPFLPARLLCRARYNALAAVQKRRCPLLVVHSPDDEIVPFAHGRRLFEAAPPPKGFLEIRGDHGSGFLVSGEIYRKGLAAFLKRDK